MLTTHTARLAPIIFALGLPLALGGCGSDKPQPLASGSFWKSPTPLPAGEYRQQLAAAAGPVNTALDEVARANSMSSVGTALSNAATQASNAADDLDKLKPPDDALSEHDDLVAAYRDLDSDLTEIQQSSQTDELCATSSVLGRVRQAESVQDLPDAGDALSALGYTVDIKIPNLPKEQNRRLGNGSFIRSGSRGGRGEFTIDNGTDTDAVVSLAKSKKPAFTVYVRKGAKYKVSGVTDGTYRVYFTSGEDWDKKSKAFTRSCTFKKFDNSAKFTTTYYSTQYRYTTYSISLQPVFGGNTTTSDVPKGAFPAP